MKYSINGSTVSLSKDILSEESLNTMIEEIDSSYESCSKAIEAYNLVSNVKAMESFGYKATEGLGESIKNGAKAIWEKIKEFFKKIIQYCVKIGSFIGNLFKSVTQFITKKDRKPLDESLKNDIKKMSQNIISNTSTDSMHPIKSSEDITENDYKHNTSLLETKDVDSVKKLIAEDMKDLIGRYRQYQAYNVHNDFNNINLFVYIISSNKDQVFFNKFVEFFKKAITRLEYFESLTSTLHRTDYNEFDYNGSIIKTQQAEDDAKGKTSHIWVNEFINSDLNTSNDISPDAALEILLKSYSYNVVFELSKENAKLVSSLHHALKKVEVTSKSLSSYVDQIKTESDKLNANSISDDVNNNINKHKKYISQIQLEIGYITKVINLGINVTTYLMKYGRKTEKLYSHLDTLISKANTRKPDIQVRSSYGDDWTNRMNQPTYTKQ